MKSRWTIVFFNCTGNDGYVSKREVGPKTCFLVRSPGNKGFFFFFNLYSAQVFHYFPGECEGRPKENIGNPEEKLDLESQPPPRRWPPQNFFDINVSLAICPFTPSQKYAFPFGKGSEASTWKKFDWRRFLPTKPFIKGIFNPETHMSNTLFH